MKKRCKYYKKQLVLTSFLLKVISL